MRKYEVRLLLVLIITFVYLGIGCTQVKGMVEISIDDYSFNGFTKQLTLYIQAESTGDVGVENVSCDVNLIVDGSSHGTKSISFPGVIDPGDTKTKSVSFSNVVANYSWSVEFSDIEVDVAGPSCSNITS